MSQPPLRTIGAIGDIHAEDLRLETALRFLKAENPDLLVAVGDIADGRGDLDRSCELLREYHVTAVRGNHERWLLAGTMRQLPDAHQNVSDSVWNYLRYLPRVVDLETVAGKLMLCHGLYTYDMGGVRPHNEGDDLESMVILSQMRESGEYRFIINGHTHRRMVRTFDNLTIINAGTIFRIHSPCFLLADFAAGFVQYYNLADDLTITQAERFELPTGTNAIS